MTVVLGCTTTKHTAIIVTDSAIGYGDGSRRLMSQGKYWNMGCLLIGEAGSDFALSRIRHKTLQLAEAEETDGEAWLQLKDPYTFSRMICDVQTEVKGTDGIDDIDADLLHVAGDEEDHATLHLVGGDGGVTGPYKYTAIGSGQTAALPLMSYIFSPKRWKAKDFTEIKVTNALLEIAATVAAHCESVEGPFHPYTFNPLADYQAL